MENLTARGSLPLQDMHLFLSSFRQEFRYAGTKPHVLFAGRMEGDLMAGCGQNATSASGYAAKVKPCFAPTRAVRHPGASR